MLGGGGSICRRGSKSAPASGRPPSGGTRRLAAPPDPAVALTRKHSHSPASEVPRWCAFAHDRRREGPAAGAPARLSSEKQRFGSSGLDSLGRLVAKRPPRPKASPDEAVSEDAPPRTATGRAANASS